MAPPDSRQAKTKPAPDRSGDRVTVLLPLPLGRGYTYGVPADLDLAPGDFVAVPLGPRTVTGVVWDREPEDVPAGKLKSVLERLPAPPLPDVSRRFVEWVAAYNMSSWGAVLKMAMSVPAALQPEKSVRAYVAAPDPPPFKMTKARERVLAVLAEGPARTGADIASEAGAGASVIKGLADAGVLARADLAPPPAFEIPDWAAEGPTLSTDQQTAAEALCKDVKSGGFGVTVIEGVPGSGKTEVYLEAVAAALEQGKQALVMLPEIALSAQWLQRFRARFGVAPAVWHSDLTGVQRRRTWRAVADGQARVVVGARSSLYLPFANLAVIAVDEEHDQSFKQDEGVIYNARDMAVVRAQLGEIPAILVTATPSLETDQNVRSGRYSHHLLPVRHGGASLPEISIVDMRSDKPERGHWLSPSLVEAMKKTFAAGEQVLLFLNRRGYAPLTLCRKCGHRLQCPQCSAWLVEHRLLGRLQCHHCGYAARQPERCSECDAEDQFTACGPGVERLAEEVAERFPEIAATLAVSDIINTPARATELVRSIEEREVDLIIGTQIVAKGYHFPHLTLVGVVDADLGLAGGDLRAAERTFQLLYQVAGRAGRAERPGRVLMQTYMPDHPVIQALSEGDSAGFLEAEARDRQGAGMPPFGRLVGIIVSGTDERLVDAAASALGRSAPRSAEVQILGPAPAPMAVLRGRHRRRFLVKAGRSVNIQERVRHWLRNTSLPKKVRVQTDVDPYSFL
ncbi:MAG: primosomal protein N' [Rhodospirillaceae bacterium]|jgi:primosomal protein N' (replication factor Y)|nr:primosomal protein N' [Rhodospirillaceae bacterium]MBT3886256.1 primosomal protein N' [Rhodospirillaceae bacterium]MBT4114907.1 primosomal protein N' [Rhodospirillaceae bacterium]MBT4671189.1 primosomal protein N' [Rhodospirillaceae bacterium]MBT4718955.1 primosomal protein N' [Rhodospirillaceae bacterium]